MDSNQGLTITPTLYVDENGIEQLSYDSPQIFDHAQRRQEYNEVTDQQENYIYDDGYGNRSHQFDYGDQGEQFDHGYQSLEDYEYESDEDDESESESELDYETQELIMDYFYENVGDQDYLDDVYAWAGEYLNDSDTDDFNDIIDNSDDPKLVLGALIALCEAYEESEETDY